MNDKVVKLADVESLVIRAIVQTPQIDAASPSAEPLYRAMRDLEERAWEPTDQSPRDDAFGTLAKIWEQLERAARLVHTRMNHLLVQRPLPPLAPAPSWLIEAVAELKAAGVNDEMLQRAHDLVCAIVAVPDGKLELDELGRVVGVWRLKAGVLVWALEPTDLAWPNIKVLSLLMREEKDEVRYFNNAFSATEYFATLGGAESATEVTT